MKIGFLRRRATEILVVALCASTLTTQGSLAADFVLGPGDRLSVSVYKRPDISGEFRVQPDGELALPFINPLTVAGRTLEQARKLVGESLRREASMLDPRVNIDLLETRPIFVSGAVRRPGSYPYQTGMTVLHAISAAGGPRILELDEFNARAEVSHQRERLRQSQDEYGMAKLRAVRVRAETEGRSEFEAPPEVVTLLSEARLHEGLTIESRILAQRNASYKSQLDILDRQGQIYEEEIQALRDQYATKAQEGDLIKQESLYQEDLLSKGLTPRTGRTIELRRIIIQVEGEMRQIVSAQAKARQEIARVQQARLLLQTQRDSEIATATKEADDAISRLKVTMEETTRLLLDAHEVLPEPNSASKPTESRYTITRTVGGASVTLTASSSTALQPGDLIEAPSH